ncbi:substrate-binding domain-containing protein [soil metagenome]
MDINPRNSGRRATLRQVASKLGVSPSTVSNAYNRPDQLSAGLRQRIFEVAAQLDYAGPDPTARSLRRRRAGAIGVIYADRLSYAFADPAAVMFLEGVSAATEEAGLGLLLAPGSPRETRDPEAVLGAVVDGFIVYCMPEEDPLVKAALSRQLPVVFVDQPQHEGLPSVGIDDEGAAWVAAEYLIGLGHRRFGIVSLELTGDPQGGIVDASRQKSATFWPSRARLQGYTQAIAAARFSNSPPVYECLENTRAQGRSAAEALLAQEPRPTALLAMSDRAALGALEAARQLGLSVPRDLSIIGFDDVPEARQAKPPLTTIRQPHVEKGLKAGKLLVGQLGGDRSSATKVLQTRLIVRGSTARVRGS